MINQLNFCFTCSYRCKPRKLLPNSLIKINQTNIAPWIHQAVNQKWDLK